jgi:hypothetical protein
VVSIHTSEVGSERLASFRQVIQRCHINNHEVLIFELLLKSVLLNQHKQVVFNSVHVASSNEGG